VPDFGAASGAPITFVVSLFASGVSIYETNNNGRWYEFGFLLGDRCLRRERGSASRSRKLERRRTVSRTTPALNPRCVRNFKEIILPTSPAVSPEVSAITTVRLRALPFGCKARVLGDRRYPTARREFLSAHHRPSLDGSDYRHLIHSIGVSHGYKALLRT